MARKKKRPLASELNIELVVWEDHRGGDNDEIHTEIPTWISIGAVSNEDDKILELISTVRDEDAEDLNTASQVTYSRILKSAITSREVLAKVPNPLNEPEPTK